MAEPMELNLNDELIKAAHFQSMEAYKHNKESYITKKHANVSSSSSSSSSKKDVLIFSFKGSSEIEDWYDDDGFGETDVDQHLFPSLLRIGEGRLAKVNKAFLKSFKDLLKNPQFKDEVEKAVKEGKKILLTGHSSGGAIASFATLWILEEFARKQRKKVSIRCVTFGCPLIGDENLSHAARRQNWAARFTHFVMEHDIVPRIMLAPKTSVHKHLPDILKYFQQKLEKISNILKKAKTQELEITISRDQAAELFENVTVKASAVARNAAFDLMEPTNLLMGKLSSDYVKVSPYTPFGTYVFCIRGKQQLFVESPDAVLQLLFCFLQLTDERQDLADFALDRLDESLSYEEELNKGLQRDDLKNFNDYELGKRARWCLMAVQEAEKRKKENEQELDKSRRTNNLPQIQSNVTNGKITEDILDAIRRYKESHAEGQMDYYDSFMLQDKRQDDDIQDFKANINRLELAKIWDVVMEMLLDKDLPDEFEGREEWVVLGTEFRRLVEPLDIGNYYRHDKGSGYMDGNRPKRYRFPQRWYEHANVTGFKLVSESNFMGVVEQQKKELKEPKNRTKEEIKEEFESIQEKILMWKSDKRIKHEDVYWGEPTLSILRESLSS